MGLSSQAVGLLGEALEWKEEAAMSKERRKFQKHPRHRGVVIVTRPDGSVRYRIRPRGSDRRQHTQTFKRAFDAERALRNAKVDVDRNEWVDPRAGKTKFGEVAEKWMASRTVEPSAASRDRAVVQAHILPTFGDRAVNSIKVSEITTWQKGFTDNGLAASTVQKYVQIFGQIFNFALDDGLIKANPVAKVKRPKVHDKEIAFLTPEDSNDLAEAVESRYRAMVLLAAYRGLRWGELAGLRPAAMNFLTGEVEIREALKELPSGHFYFGAPKHGKIRTIRLPKFLVKVLQAHITEFRPRPDPITGEPLIFTSNDGQLLRRSNFRRRVFLPAIRKAGVDPKLTFHSLRHSAVSILAAEGAGITEVSAIFGWSRSTAAKMYSRYAHLFEAREDVLTERVEDAYQRAEEVRRLRVSGEVRSI
jgi:integrase